MKCESLFHGKNINLWSAEFCQLLKVKEELQSSSNSERFDNHLRYH